MLNISKLSLEHFDLQNLAKEIALYSEKFQDGTSTKQELINQIPDPLKQIELSENFNPLLDNNSNIHLKSKKIIVKGKEMIEVELENKTSEGNIKASARFPVIKRKIEEY